jgi:hypothetical protein
MSKNFVDNDNATALMGAVEESIANTRILKGTFDDYNALTPEEKAKYSYVATPEIPGGAITDAVTDGDMRPVTSNAVYNVLRAFKIIEFVTSATYTLTAGQSLDITLSPYAIPSGYTPFGIVNFAGGYNGIAFEKIYPTTGQIRVKNTLSTNNSCKPAITVAFIRSDLLN